MNRPSAGVKQLLQDAAQSVYKERQRVHVGRCNRRRQSRNRRALLIFLERHRLSSIFRGDGSPPRANAPR